MLIPARVSTGRIVPAASRVAWFAALSLLAAPTGALAGAEPARKPWTVDDVVRVRDLTEPQVSPDGRWVVFVVSEADEGENAYNTDLYLLPAGGGGTGRTAEAIRLTRSPKPDHRPRWSPDGRTIAFLSGRESAGGPGGGGEGAARDEKREQVWLIRPDGGEPWQPAALEGSISDFAWSPDGTLLALLVREPKSEERRKREKEKDDALVVDSEIRRDQVFVMDSRTGVAVQATRGSVHFTDLDWAPDGRRLALAGQPTPKVPDDLRSDIYTLDLSEALRALRDEAGRREQTAGGPRPALAEPVPVVTSKGADGHPRFSPDGSTLVFLTQDGSEEWFTNHYVATAPAAGGAPRVLTRAFDEEAEDPRFTADGKAIVFEGQARLARHLFSAPAGGGEIRRLTPGDDVHRESSWSRDGRVAALVRESPTGPPEISVLTTPSKRGGAALRPLSRLNDWTGDYATIAKEPFRWKGKDGLDLEGLLVRPAGAATGKPAPLLVVIHGGPAGFFSNNFTVRRGVYPVQLFAQKGFAVLMPNPRGSGGYGETFRKANVRDWGGGDYDDIMAGIDALVAAGAADPARLGIMGWSYGGFMTSRVLTKTGRFKAASVGAAVTDTVSFVGVTDIPPFMRSYFNAWPWEDPSVYTSHTAIYNASAITTPTLIQHGEADARVPISQGWELYVALKEKGVPVEFVTYPRQGHPILEPKLIRDAMRRNLEWFSRFIPAETAK